VGRITFSNESQILVDFENSTNPIEDEAWNNDFLRLKGIQEISQTFHDYQEDHATAFDELYYKQSSFYIRRNPFELPQTVQDDFWFSTLPISDEDSGRPSVEIHYVNLFSLASNIDTSVQQINSTTGTSLVSLKYGENKFPFDFVKGRTQLFVRHVRILLFYKETSEGTMVYKESEEMPALRYDKTKRKFYNSKNEELNEKGFIRSSVLPYNTRDGKRSLEEEEKMSFVVRPPSSTTP